MYEHYYGLSEKPFDLTPDTDFYFQSLTHQQALNVLLVAIKSGDGFIKLTGEVGTGKTLLCRKLLEMLDEHYQTVYIPNPYMSCDALLKAVTEEMGLLHAVQDNNYLSVINHQLIENARQQRSTVILLDEAQSLPIESLEAIRLLSNLETEKQKLVQIVLFGQPELDQKLSDNSIRQLRQRIVHASHLKSFDLNVLAQYLEHRLKAAGFNGPCLFSDRAIKLLYKKSHGVPRLVNVISHKALMLAYSSGDFYVSQSHIQQACDDSHHNVQTLTSKLKAVGTLAAVTYLTMQLEILTPFIDAL